MVGEPAMAFAGAVFFTCCVSEFSRPARWVALQLSGVGRSLLQDGMSLILLTGCRLMAAGTNPAAAKESVWERCLV
jgi:hypothetical protein